MPRYNDGLAGTSKFRTQQLSPEDQMQGLINQAAYIGHSVSQTRLKELKKEIEQRHNLEMRSVDKGVGIPTDSLLFPRLDTYGIKSGSYHLSGERVA